MKRLNQIILCLALSVCLTVTWILAGALPVKAGAAELSVTGLESVHLYAAEPETSETAELSVAGLEPAEDREKPPEAYQQGELSAAQEANTQKNANTNYKGANNGVTWNYSEGTLTVSGKGNIPDYSSGAPWRSYSYNIEKLVISEGITGIGEAAFYGCSCLTDVSLPGTLINIGTAAFANCYSLETITIPGKVTEIKDYAFQSCRLKSVMLPASLKSWSHLAFFDCDQLENITVASGNSVYKSADGVLFSKDGKMLCCFPVSCALYDKIKKAKEKNE